MFNNYDNFVRVQCRKATADQITRGYLSVHTQPKIVHSAIMQQVSQPMQGDLSVVNQVIRDPVVLEINHKKNSYDKTILELNKVSKSKNVSSLVQYELLESKLRLETRKLNEDMIRDTLKEKSKKILVTLATDVKKYLAENASNPIFALKQQEISGYLKLSKTSMSLNKETLINYIIGANSIFDEELNRLSSVIRQPVKSVLLSETEIIESTISSETATQPAYEEYMPLGEEEEVPELETV